MPERATMDVLDDSAHDATVNMTSPTSDQEGEFCVNFQFLVPFFWCRDILIDNHSILSLISYLILYSRRVTGKRFLPSMIFQINGMNLRTVEQCYLS